MDRDDLEQDLSHLRYTVGGMTTTLREALAVESTTGGMAPDYDKDLLKIFMEMYPGRPEEDLAQLNERVLAQDSHF